MSFLYFDHKEPDRNDQSINWFQAAETGDLQTIQSLLNESKNTDGLQIYGIRNEHGETALQIASSNNHRHIIEELLHYKHNNSTYLHSKNAPILIKAALEGYKCAFEVLLKDKDLYENIDVEGPDGKTSLFWSSRHGQPHVVSLLLQHGANPFKSDQYDFTPLHTASRHAHSDVVQLLLQHYCDQKGNQPSLDARNHKGETPLILAAKGTRITPLKRGPATLHSVREQVLESLLEHGAEVNAQDHNGYSALYYAALYNRRLMVEILLNHGANIALLNNKVESDNNNNNNNNNSNGKVGSIDSNGQPVLISVVTSVQLAPVERNDMVEFLLRLGADADVTDTTGNTPLFYAVTKLFDGDLANLLLDRGGQIGSSIESSSKIIEQFNMPNKESGTVLYNTVANGNVKLVEILLKLGIEVNALDPKTGHSPLFVASDEGYDSIAILLLQNGANPDLTDAREVRQEANGLTRFHINDGRTPLYQAAKNGHDSIVQTLLKYDADPYLCDKDGRIPMDVASGRGVIEQILRIYDYFDSQKDVYNDKYPTPHLGFLEYKKKPTIPKLKEVIHGIVRYPQFKKQFWQIFQKSPEIVHWKDDEGRTVLQVACRACRSVTFFLERYELESAPRYESTTCQVYFALDWGCAQSTENEEKGQSSMPSTHSEATAVALKFIQKREHFENEIDVRRSEGNRPRFDPMFVTVDLESYRCKTDPEYAKAAKDWGKFDFCIILERGDRSLLEVVNAENLLRKPHEIRSILKEVAECIVHVHEKGYVHGDIKPRNLLRQTVDKKWKLIDFDATTRIGEPIGLKTSTAFAPPELISVSATDHDTTRVQLLSKCTLGLKEDQYLMADKTFDVWSFGLMMYFLVTGQTLLHTNVEDNLTDLKDLAELNDNLIAENLNLVSDGSARALLSGILKVKASERLTMEKILDHVYFKTQIGTVPKDLVFINYRRQDSAFYAQEIANALTTALGNGAVFFDKDSIDIGQEWPERIKSGLRRCRYLLVLIGPLWLSAGGLVTRGSRRLDQQNDWVRKEIEQGLTQKNTKVIPVLVNNATVPCEEELPVQISPLLSWQCCILRDDHLPDDLATLTSKILDNIQS